MTALDIKAAFDRVASRRPSQAGINGYQGANSPLAGVILVHKKMVVVVEGQSSQLQDISAGVLQGHVLGPTIFSCFINDLPSVIMSEVGMFVNDCTLFCTIHNSSLILKQSMFKCNKIWTISRLGLTSGK